MLTLDVPILTSSICLLVLQTAANPGNELSCSVVFSWILVASTQLLHVSDQTAQSGVCPFYRRGVGIRLFKLVVGWIIKVTAIVEAAWSINVWTSLGIQAEKRLYCRYLRHGAPWFDGLLETKWLPVSWFVSYNGSFPYNIGWWSISIFQCKSGCIHFRQFHSPPCSTLRLTVFTVLRMVPDGLLLAGPDCRSWGLPCRSTTGRSPINIFGWQELGFVSQANIMVSRFLAHMFALWRIVFFQLHGYRQGG